MVWHPGHRRPPRQVSGAPFPAPVVAQTASASTEAFDGTCRYPRNTRGIRAPALGLPTRWVGSIEAILCPPKWPPPSTNAGLRRSPPPQIRRKLPRPRNLPSRPVVHPWRLIRLSVLQRMMGLTSPHLVWFMFIQPPMGRSPNELAPLLQQSPRRHSLHEMRRHLRSPLLLPLS